MKKQLLFFLTIILSFNCYSQISFEEGYFIDNKDQKTNCLIKNVDWKNNPTEFEYKLSKNSESKKKTIESIKEFGIVNISKYVRSIVNIDRSIENIEYLSYDRNPVFKEEKLFLKVLVEGKANLYLFEDGNLIRYFYNKENSAIEQLIFKSYKTSNNKIGKNNRFKNQLWNNLKCPNFQINKVENLDYQKKDLIDYFEDYNECNGEKNINYEKKQKKDLFNLSIRPGLNSSSLSLRQFYLASTTTTEFDNEVGFRFGIEAEIIMPFNKNKWAVIVEPTYQYFKSKKRTTINNFTVDYKSIEIPVGIRHYFFLNENSKIFINGSFVIDFSFDSTINDLIIKTQNNYAFGLGYKYNDRYSFEFRYQTSREILRNYVNLSSNYNTLSVILGYSLF